MHKVILTLFTVFFFLSNFQIFAQNNFAEIEKNINFRARILQHDLNKTKDTLVLKSDNNIGYIYSIHKEKKYDINNCINEKEYKLALRGLAKGKHVFVVVQQSLKIVFVIKIYGEKNLLISALGNK